jgi:hypothetical protein
MTDNSNPDPGGFSRQVPAGVTFYLGEIEINLITQTPSLVAKFAVAPIDGRNRGHVQMSMQDISEGTVEALAKLCECLTADMLVALGGSYEPSTPEPVPEKLEINSFTIGE